MDISSYVQKQINYSLVTTAVNSTVPSDEEITTLKDRIEGIAEYIEQHWKSLLVKTGITLTVFLGAWYFLNKMKTKILGKINDVIHSLEQKAEEYLNTYIKTSKLFLSFSDEQKLKIKKALAQSNDFSSFKEKLSNQLSLELKDKNLHNFLDNLNQSWFTTEFKTNLLNNYLSTSVEKRTKILNFLKEIEKKEKYIKYVKTMMYIYVFIIACGVFLYFYAKNKKLKENIIYENVNSNVLIKIKNIFTQKILKNPFIERLQEFPTWTIPIYGVGSAFLFYLIIIYKKEKSLRFNQNKSFLDFVYTKWKNGAMKWKGVILFSFLACSSFIYMLLRKG